MRTQKYIVTIYIHPDSGPITPMHLDVAAVQEALYRAPGGISQDEVGANEIARQIRQRFPKVNTESDRRQIVAMMGRLSHADIFNGIVVRLGGNIDDPSSTSTQNTLSELEHINRDVAQMRVERVKERREYEALKARIYGLDNENKRYKNRYEQASNQLEDMQVRMKQAQREATRAIEATERAQREADISRQEAVALKTRLELVQRELQERPAQSQNEGELSSLRYQLRNAEKAEEQLRAYIEDLKQENATLQERLRYLTEGPDAASGASFDSASFDDFSL